MVVFVIVGIARNHHPRPSAEMDKMKRQIGVALKRRISSSRFQVWNAESLLRNYYRIMDHFTRGRRTFFPTTMVGLAMSEAEAQRVISDFPQLCLYAFHELEQRIQFFVKPYQTPPSSSEDVDWVQRSGGAGWSVAQATEAIRCVPRLCALYPEDAQKPSMLYFYQRLNIPTDAVEFVSKQLPLEGADISDACCFAFFSLQLQICPQVFSSTLTF